jgi:ATP-dependent exoDNAse (exonuclease V) beta subunit
MATRLRERPASAESLAALAGDVEAMLRRFEETPLAATLRDPSTAAQFEMPFAWDWEGVPVHGTIDLAYRLDGHWHVVDFKTDATAGRDMQAIAEPYLAQLGLYGSALQAATGTRPALWLCFLRTGAMHQLDWVEVDAALVTARVRVDAGAELVPEGAAEAAE